MPLVNTSKPNVGEIASANSFNYKHHTSQGASRGQIVGMAIAQGNLNFTQLLQHINRQQSSARLVKQIKNMFF
jgi:hypothetical protein